VVTSSCPSLRFWSDQPAASYPPRCLLVGWCTYIVPPITSPPQLRQTIFISCLFIYLHPRRVSIDGSEVRDIFCDSISASELNRWAHSSNARVFATIDMSYYPGQQYQGGYGGPPPQNGWQQNNYGAPQQPYSP